MPTLCFTYHTVVSLQIQRTPFCLLDTFIYVAPLESDKMMMMMIKNVKVPSHTVDQSTVCQRLHCSSSYHTVVSWRMENNVLWLLFTSLELELEIVHNKKKHLLQDDRRERSSKLIYIPCDCKDENQVFFNTRQWFTSYYLLTQIILFVYYSVTIRIFHNVEPTRVTLFYVTLIDDLFNWILVEQKINPHRCHRNLLLS